MAEVRSYVLRMEASLARDRGLDTIDIPYTDIGPIFSFLDAPRKRDFPMRYRDVGTSSSDKLLYYSYFYGLNAVADVAKETGDWVRAAELYQWFIQYNDENLNGTPTRSYEVMRHALHCYRALIEICLMHGEPDEADPLLDSKSTSSKLTLKANQSCVVDVTGYPASSGVKSTVVCRWVPAEPMALPASATWDYYESAVDRRSAVIDAYDVELNPFYLLPIRHTIQCLATEQSEIVDVCVSASAPIRIEFYNEETSNQQARFSKESAPLAARQAELKDGHGLSLTATFSLSLFVLARPCSSQLCLCSAATHARNGSSVCGRNDLNRFEARWLGSSVGKFFCRRKSS